MNKDTNYISLYNKEGEHILEVRLNLVGKVAYDNGDKILPEYFDLILDVRGINSAEF